MAYRLHRYTGDYSTYGMRPEFNWFDFMWPTPPGSDASSSGGAGSSSGASGPTRPKTPGVHTGQSGPGGAGGHAPDLGGRGGPVTPTGHTTSPYEGAGGALSPSKAGLIKGVLSTLDPTPGNMLTSLGEFAYSPSAYTDTRPMTIPGVGTMATAPGVMRGFLNVMPFGGMLANAVGQLTADQMAKIANATYGNEKGYALGRYSDMYGRPQTVGISPGPFGNTSVMTGPGQFGWQSRQKILQDLRTRAGVNSGRGGGWNDNDRGDPGRSGQDAGRGGSRPEGGMGRRAMRSGGPVRRFGFGGKVFDTIKEDILPIGLGAATSYLTGSDILGGAAAGLSSKLLGAGWGEALGIGALTGLGSAFTGLSGDGPGMLGLGGALDAGDRVNAGINTASGEPGGGGGFLSGVGDWLSNNPEKAVLGGALALGALGGMGGGSDEPEYDDEPPEGFNDPELTEQIQNGGNVLDRAPTMPNGNYNWYAYGQVPEWQFFDNVNAPTVPAMKSGGPAADGVAQGNKSALAILGSVPKGRGGGQDDVVPAALAHGEHVLDADVVSALGDGDNDEGHRKIEQMKKNIRKQKRSAPVTRIPPRAKSPLDYLNRAQ